MREGPDRAAIDERSITMVARAALGRPRAEVVSWRSESVGYLRVWQGSGGVQEPIPEWVWAEPSVRDALGETFGERFGAAWARADALAAAVERLPATFVHRDAFRANLMRRGENLVAIDWALAGPGRLGEELFKMLLGSCALLHWHGGAAALDTAIYPAYLAGLREAGWDGDERLVRFGYAARAVAGLPRVQGVLRLLIDPTARSGAAARFGRPAEEIAAIRADFNRFSLDLVESASGL